MMTVPSDDPPSDDVIIVDELTLTPEQRALAGFSQATFNIILL